MKNLKWENEKEEILEEYSWQPMSKIEMLVLLGYAPTTYLKDVIWWQKGHLQCIEDNLWQLLPNPLTTTESSEYRQFKADEKKAPAKYVNDLEGMSTEERQVAVIGRLMRKYIKERHGCKESGLKGVVNYAYHSGGLHAINEFRELLGIEI